MDRSVQGKKVQTGYTPLIEVPSHEIQNTESRPDHNTENFMPFMFLKYSISRSIKRSQIGSTSLLGWKLEERIALIFVIVITLIIIIVITVINIISPYFPLLLRFNDLQHYKKVRKQHSAVIR